MQKDEKQQRLNSFLEKAEKTDTEKKIELKILNGFKQLEEAQKALADISQKKLYLESSIVALQNQIKALWDLVLDLDTESKEKVITEKQ